MAESVSRDIEKTLRARIKELENENRKLKLEIKRLKNHEKGYYTLEEHFGSSVDLGAYTNKPPSSIPDHKKWSANDYPEDWSPEKKASEYLLSFWKNYPVSQSFFSNVRGGQAFYKYLKRNNLSDLLLNSFQLELKKRIANS